MAVELRHRETFRLYPENLIGPEKFLHFPLNQLKPGAVIVGHRRWSCTPASLVTAPAPQRLRRVPDLPAIDTIASQSER